MLCETPAPPLQRNKDAVRRFKKSRGTTQKAAVTREVVAPRYQRARGGTVPDTIHRICDTRDIRYDFPLK